MLGSAAGVAKTQRRPEGAAGRAATEEQPSRAEHSETNIFAM